MLDAIRLGSADDATPVTATEPREVITRLVHAGQWQLGDADVLAVKDTRYGVTHLAHVLADLPVEPVGRSVPLGPSQAPGYRIVSLHPHPGRFDDVLDERAEGAASDGNDDGLPLEGACGQVRAPVPLEADEGDEQGDQRQERSGDRQRTPAGRHARFWLCPRAGPAP
ncbi:hypothetical protein [Streptomyces sp. TUS-ST3]|uniref:hypothetical protein n=1 Tax=Streptomyces sp. TUS-ST3 TaxID=3025591 RepID=UPI0024E15885|nr:hypothetical protein [Streptomyces sp. TUS-ST3]